MYYCNERVKNIERKRNKEERIEYLRLDMNENPKGLPKEFVDKVFAQITPEYLAMYPETATVQSAIAEYIGINSEQICITNGSDEAIRLIFEVFSKKGGNIVIPYPTFAMYEVYANIYGVDCKKIDFKGDMTFPLEKFLEAIGKQTNLVFALNPNNPTGSVFSEAEMNLIIKKATENDALVVIDEAYYYFCKKTYMDLVNKYDNVIVLRTFSKICSLATCRVGYAISNPFIIKMLENAECSYNVNGVALKFVEELLKENLIPTLVKEHDEEKCYLVQCLLEEGYEINANEGNFIFVKCKNRAEKIAQQLKNKKILVKYYSQPSFLKEYIRITTANKNIMETFLQVFFEIDNSKNKTR